MRMLVVSASLVLSILALVSPAAAQETPTSSPLKITNNAHFTIDCRVYWGSTVINFDRVMPGTVSTKSIVRSNTERSGVCKVTGKTGTQYMSNTLKFYTSDYADYDIVCTSTMYSSGPQLKCVLKKTLL